MLRKLYLLIFLFFAVTMSYPLQVSGAGSSNQTILSPSSPRKLQYPKIVIYTVAWCPHCRELKEYLTSRNIPFINRDVELEPAAMEELAKKYSTYGVPVVVIGTDQEVLKGFTAEQFEKSLARARSGVRK